MEKATAEFLKQNEEFYIKRKAEIVNAPDSLEVKGNTYYVSTAGDDSNSGTSPDTSWKSLKKISEADLNPGDAVFFAEAIYSAEQSGQSRAFLTEHTERVLNPHSTAVSMTMPPRICGRLYIRKKHMEM